MYKYLILFLICGANAFSQVKLELVFPASNSDFDLSVYKYTDYLLPTKEPVVLPEIPDSGSKLNVDIELAKPAQIIINIGTLSKKLFVQPTNTYQIILSENKINIISKDSINTVLDSVDTSILRFRNEIFELESQKSTDWEKEVISLMQNLTDELSQTKGTDFQQQLIKYKLAQAKAIALDVIQDQNAYMQLAEEFLLNNEVQYQNAEYMDFLYDYYYRWFRNFAWSDEKYADAAYDFEIMKSIADDIQNQTIRQLVLINFSKNAYGLDKTEDDSEIIQILDYLSKSGTQEQLKDASAQLILKFSALQVGSTLPAVTFYDLEGKEFNQSAVDGKYVLLDFWFIGCRPCYESVPFMKNLYEKYGACLEILSINDQDNSADIKKYKFKEEIEWIFLKGNKNDEAYSSLNVRYYPTFYLIDPHGKIALTPSGQIREIFESIELYLKENCPQ